MRKVCRLARQVLDIVAAELKPGITTDYLDEVCHKACIERNVSATRFKMTLIISNLDSHILLP
jgi:methionyl aminopeptidase